MQSFGEQLYAVRKKSGFTQDQLARAMNISRTTVSRWETGRALPDIETIKALSKLLHFNFFTVEEIAISLHPDQAAELAKKPPVEEQDEAAEQAVETDPEPEPVVEEPEKAQEAPTAAPKPQKRQLVVSFLLGAGTMALVLAALLLVMPADNLAAKLTNASYSATMYTREWYQHASSGAVEKNQAMVNIQAAESPVMVRTTEPFSEEEPGWIYEFRLMEMNGVSFNVDSMMVTTFNADGSQNSMRYKQEEVVQCFGSATMETGAQKSFRGGFGVQPVEGVGLLLQGTDENGHELEFHGYVALSQEQMQAE